MNSSDAVTELTVPPAATSVEPFSVDKNPFERIMPLLVFLFCLAYLCVPLRYSSIEPDEGIVLQGAERVLHGQVPYRDFFSFYTPGSYYFLALCFRLFGDAFVIARFSIALTGAACSVLTYILTRRVCGRWISLMMAILATTVGTGFRFLVLHNWYSTLLSFLGLYFAVRFVESEKAKFLFLCGSFASLTILFEQSKGAGLCLGVFGGLLILQLTSNVRLLKKIPLAAVTSGLALPFVVTFWFFASHHVVNTMFQNWLWPLRHYIQANHVPYGYQNWSEASRAALFKSGPLWIRVVKALAVSPDFIVPVLPLIGVSLLLYFSLRTWRKQPIPNANYYILVCSTASGLLVSVLVSRADILHFIYLAPVLYIILGWILQGPQFSTHSRRAARRYMISYVAIAFGLLSIAILLQAAGAHERVTTRRGVILTGGQDKVLPYVQKHIPSGTQFLVYPYLPLYNYLTATISPSRYDYIQPGMNTREQAEEVVGSLMQQRPEALLFEPWFAEKISNSWPGTSMQMIANDPVVAFVSRNYRVCELLNSATEWRFEYMVRHDLPCGVKQTR